MSDSVPLPLDPDRLNGWKEIASHLGKGVRTVQRWEKVYGLPVHRIGEGGGEIVYAFRHEIDAWLKSVERAPAAEPSADRLPPADVPPGAVNGRPRGDASRARIRNRHAAAAGAPVSPPEAERQPRPVAARAVAWGQMSFTAGSLLLIVAMAVVWLATSAATGSRTERGGPAVRQPATYKFQDQALVVFDDAGAELWRYPLEATWPPGWQPAIDARWSGPVAILDLDNDGSREVLFTVPHSSPRQRLALVCMDADGAQRWARLPADTQRFGDADYGAPWVSGYFLATRNADGTRTVWATFQHGLLFPSVLEQIDRAGEVRSRYWSNGYISSLGEGTWGGRPVLFVGAANNEHKGASLAILDRDDPSGVAPAVNPKYRCDTCPPGDPLGFVVFPPSPVGRVRNDTTGINEAWVNGAGELTVNVQESAPGVAFHGGLYYTLDQQLRPLRLEVAVFYQQLHDQLFKQGRIDRAYSPSEERRLVPILRWDGNRFVEEPLAGGR